VITTRRLALAGFALLLVARLAAGTPEVFQKITFEKAKERSVAEKKLLLVDATAEWCGPCKMMDKTTWVDEKVVEWLNANAVAIQIDVDALPELSKQLRIRAMPTVIAFRDGEEFDRSVGLQEPGPLLEWLDGVNAGKTAIDSMKENLQGGEIDVEQRLRFAEQLMTAGKYDESTDEYVWLWENMLKHSPHHAGVRGSFMAGDMQQLVSEHEPARARFAKLRDATEARLTSGKSRSDDRDDWIVLNEVVGDNERTLAWFDAVKNDPSKREELDRSSFRIEDMLEEQGRWADRGRLMADVTGFLSRAFMMHNMTLASVDRRAGGPGPNADQDRAMMEEFFRTDMAKAYASLLAAGRDKNADRVAKAVREAKPDGLMSVALVEWALHVGRARAEHLEWLEEAKKQEHDVGVLEERVRSALHDQRDSEAGGPED